MIKIIKKGTRDIRECESCGCLFSFDAEDVEVKVKVSESEFLKYVNLKYVKCPQCSFEVEIEIELKKDDSDPSPCRDCKVVHKESCCGCAEYVEWRKKHND